MSFIVRTNVSPSNSALASVSYSSFSKATSNEFSSFSKTTNLISSLLFENPAGASVSCNTYWPVMFFPFTLWYKLLAIASPLSLVVKTSRFPSSTLFSINLAPSRVSFILSSFVLSFILIIFKSYVGILSLYKANETLTKSAYGLLVIPAAAISEFSDVIVILLLLSLLITNSYSVSS